ncbi:arabinanase [Mycena rebaudengoi]|nr:arabinanase [Mycena rebaudengoi]
MQFLSSFIPVFALATLSRAVVGPVPVTGNTAVHDPSMYKSASGTYFLFSTARRLAIRTSSDRITWTLVGTVWPNGAPWTDGCTGTSNGTLWAPDCTVIDNTFYSAIFFAKSSTGMPGSWTDQGLVTSTTSALDYNVNNGNWYLSFGSFWSGIKLQQVSTTTGKPLNSSVTSFATRTAANGAIETSSIFKVGSFYYLFTSWDNTYNIRIGRSSSPTGGFVDASGVALTHGGGTSVLATHDIRIVGPGGQDLMADDDGTILIYHYYNSTGSFRTSWLLITLVGPYYANFTSSVQV